MSEEQTLNDLARECGLGGGDTLHLEAKPPHGGLCEIRALGDEVVAYAPPKYLPYVLAALQEAPGLENARDGTKRYADHLALQLKYQRQDQPVRLAVSLAAATNVEVADMANQMLGHSTPEGRVLSSIYSFAAQPIQDISMYPLGRWVAFVVYDTARVVERAPEGKGDTA